MRIKPRLTKKPKLRSRIKTRITTNQRPTKRTIGITRLTKTSLKEGRRMNVGNTIRDTEIDEDNVKLNCMDNIRNRAKAAMGGKRLTKQEARKILEIVRNEK